MQPYGEWLDSNLVQLKDIKIPNIEYGRVHTGAQRTSPESFRIYLRAVSYFYPKHGIKRCREHRSHGCDTPLAVFSNENRPLFDYFKQLFAQVTNPPIDAIREEIVTSTSVYVGKDGNLLVQQPENCHVLKINIRSSPIQICSKSRT